MKKILISLAAIMALTMGASLAVATPAGAVSVDPCSGTANQDSPLCQNSGLSWQTVIRRVINLLLLIVGAVSVIMIIFAGIRYTTSGGNANAVAGAKNTLLYAVIGLVVAMLAYTIVRWVYGEVVSPVDDGAGASSQVLPLADIAKTP